MTLPFFPPVSFVERLLFTKHLAIMVKTGIPLTEIMETLAEQTKSSVFRDVIGQILTDIKNGQSLETAFGKHPRVFDNMFIQLVAVGEKSGNLEKNLEYLSSQLEKERDLRRKIQSASFYPMVVLAASAVMGSLISFFVLPRLLDLFKDFNIELPLSTKILLFFAGIMKSYGIFIFIGLLAFLFMFITLINLARIKPYWHRFLLRIPVASGILSSFQLSQFAHNLGTLLSGGVPIRTALAITAHTLSNLSYKAALLHAEQSVSKGKRLADALGNEHYHRLFPSVAVKMIQVGERSGNLEESLLYLAKFYEDEIDALSKNFSTILEPVLLIGIGLVVAFLALSIITPIYEFTGSIH